MRAKVNISREYFVDLPFDETFSNLHKNVSSNFYNSKYCTFGNFVSPDPPEFVFMAKWRIIWMPFFSFMSTRVYAKLFKTDNKSKISVTTKSNPAIILVLIISVVSIMVSLFGYKTKDDLKLV